MSLTATLTLPVPLSRTAFRAGCSFCFVARSSPCVLLVQRAVEMHLAQHLAHRVHRLLHFGGSDRADAADAEGFHLREFARIQGETTRFGGGVDNLEIVVRVR